MRSLEDVVSASPGLPARRLLTAAFSAFGALAVLLSAIGLFGVVAHDVATRRQELGLRIALGALPMQLLLRTTGRGLLLVAVGLVVAGVSTVWAAHVLGASFPGTEGRVEVVNLGAAAVVLIAAGLVAVVALGSTCRSD